MIKDNREKYINSYIDVAFKEFFGIDFNPDNAAHLKVYRDLYSVTKTAYNKGIAEGKAEGIAEGINIVAKRLKEEGWKTEEIAKLTSLSISEIENL